MDTYNLENEFTDADILYIKRKSLVINIYKNWKLEFKVKSLKLKNREDYEKVCKKILKKNWYWATQFNNMDFQRRQAIEYDPYLKAVRELWYNLKSY